MCYSLILKKLPLLILLCGCRAIGGDDFGSQSLAEKGRVACGGRVNVEGSGVSLDWLGDRVIKIFWRRLESYKNGPFSLFFF